MEIRTFWALPLTHYTDEILSLSYLRILTDNHFESIKLPTAIANYRHRHLLSSQYLVQIEAVRTKKNWILKSIISHTKIANCLTFQDFLNLAEVTKVLETFFQEEQEVGIMEFVKESLKHIQELHIPFFERQLSVYLGFSTTLQAS